MTASGFVNPTCSQESAPAQAAAQWTGQEWSEEAWAAEEKAQAGSLLLCPLVGVLAGAEEAPVKSSLQSPSSLGPRPVRKPFGWWHCS